MPWGQYFPKWVDCCDAHDICYCMGGNDADRLNCDDDFYDCIVARTGDKKMAKNMYDAVRTHGHRYFSYH
jgi:hypothetical protein